MKYNSVPGGKCMGRVWIMVLLLAAGPVAAQREKEVLQQAVKQPVTAYLEGITQWRITQKQMLQQKTDALPEVVKQALLAKADDALSYRWPALPASLYLDYALTGTRTSYETAKDERLKKLCHLATGYLLTHNRKYLLPVVDGLYATLEESTWVLPAHLTAQKTGPGLPDPADDIIDLGCAVTAPVVASVQWMLRDELSSISPNIHKRIDAELNRRIIQPYLKRNDLWWMGMKGQAVNNWNAWINTNVLHTALYNVKSTDTLAAVVSKVLKSTDHFIAQYPADGGCEEGPSYWSHAGGKLIRLLQLLHSISEGKIDFAGDTLLHSIGSYIYKVHIAGDYFVNVGDAAAQTIPNPESVYRYGVMFSDTALQQFAAWLFCLKSKPPLLSGDNMADFLQNVDVYADLIKLKAAAPLPEVSWLPQVQVLTVRQHGGDTSGLFLAAQGGHNGESHNHNDAGNFIIYANGAPVLVDAGITVYNSKTFGKDRYSLWTMQSDWHNCPSINGYMQQAGKKYMAAETMYREGADSSVFSLRLEKAYPEDAAADYWKRSWVFHHNTPHITLQDTWQLQQWKAPSRLQFLSCCQVEQADAGQLLFKNAAGKTMLKMQFDKELYDIQIYPKPVEDSRLAGVWGRQLCHVVLQQRTKALQVSSTIQFTQP